MRGRVRCICLVSCVVTATIVAVTVGIFLTSRADNQRIRSGLPEADFADNQPVRSIPLDVYFADLERYGAQKSEVESNLAMYFRSHPSFKKLAESGQNLIPLLLERLPHDDLKNIDSRVFTSKYLWIVFLLEDLSGADLNEVYAAKELSTTIECWKRWYSQKRVPGSQ